jgi:hypothetical protein
MKLKTKLIWIFFYLLAFVCLIITGDVKLRYVGNLWKEFLKIVKKQSTEIYKNSKRIYGK